MGKKSLYQYPCVYALDHRANSIPAWKRGVSLVRSDDDSLLTPPTVPQQYWACYVLYARPQVPILCLGAFGGI